MARLKVDALFREFTFLDKYFNKAEIDDYKVERMDAALLDDNCTGGLLLDREGTKLLSVGRFPYPEGTKLWKVEKVDYCWYNLMTWSREDREHASVLRPAGTSDYYIKRERVKDALIRLGSRIDEVAFFVAREEFLSTRLGDRSKFILRIYKAPRGKKISEWVEEEIEGIRVKIAEEAAAL